MNIKSLTNTELIQLLRDIQNEINVRDKRQVVVGADNSLKEADLIKLRPVKSTLSESDKKAWRPIIIWCMAIEGGKANIGGDSGGHTYRGISANNVKDPVFRQKIIDGTATDEEMIEYYYRYIKMYNLEQIQGGAKRFYAFNEAIWGRTHLQTLLWDYFVEEKGWDYGRNRKYPDKYQRLAILRFISDEQFDRFLVTHLTKGLHSYARELKQKWNTMITIDEKGRKVTKNHAVSVAAIHRRYNQVFKGAKERLDLKIPITAGNNLNWRSMEWEVEKYAKA